MVMDNFCMLNVKCPYCSKGISEQKCISTVSVVKCGTCKMNFWAFVFDGFVTTATMESKNDMFPSEKRMKMFYNEFGNILEKIEK